ncbi:MAG: MgtC/SapB family protein [Halofilum sp. (in: g-proteobacteria)]|nr:MgtC/SapB family protein [Halofilum sp. (in: g-proteobacteria)]
MDTLEALQTLALALLLGMLVGLQRELKDKHIAGFRTFGLVTVFGAVTGLIAGHAGGWIIGAGLVGVIAVIVVGNVIKLRADRVDYGMTTEVSLLLMFAIGAWLPHGSWTAGAAAAGGTALILYSKPRFKVIIDRLEEQDIKAIMQFVLISLIILPILPNETYGPFDVFNPRLTWLLVVLITGISLAGYLMFKFVGQRTGVLLGGILGGLVSSTATTVSYARMSSASAPAARNAAVVIVLASSMVYVRMLIEIGIMAPAHFYRMGIPIIALGLFTLVVAWLVYQRITDTEAETPPQKNPSELGSALVFAGFYVFILFLMAAANELLPDDALFAVALVSGLTNMDAVTLSTSQLVSDGTVSDDKGWRLILTAFVSNTLFKFGIACTLGHAELRRNLAGAFGAIALFALALIVFLELPVAIA